MSVPHSGSVVDVRSRVVDVRFMQALPSSVFGAPDRGEKEIVIEVMEQLDEVRIRGIALTPTRVSEGNGRGFGIAGYSRVALDVAFRRIQLTTLREH